MIVFEKWKIMLIGAIIAAGVILALPNIIGSDEDSSGYMGNRINLGLDLQGGSYLLLHVEMDEVIEERISNLTETIRSEFRKERLGIKNLAANATSVSFDLRSETDRITAKAQLDDIIGSDMAITETASGFSASFTEASLNSLA